MCLDVLGLRACPEYPEACSARKRPRTFHWLSLSFCCEMAARCCVHRSRNRRASACAASAACRCASAVALAAAEGEQHEEQH